MTAPDALTALISRLRDIATKEPGYGMSFRANGIHRGAAEINLYGKRATAAHWLLEQGNEAADMLERLSATDNRAPVEDGWREKSRVERAREIAAQFYDKRDPLDRSYREVAHNIRRGRYDDQDSVELVRFTIAMLAAAPTPPTGSREDFRDRLAMAISNAEWPDLTAFREWAANHSTYPNCYKSVVDQRYASADRVIAMLAAAQGPSA